MRVTACTTYYTRQTWPDNTPAASSPSLMPSPLSSLHYFLCFPTSPPRYIASADHSSFLCDAVQEQDDESFRFLFRDSRLGKYTVVRHMSWKKFTRSTLELYAVGLGKHIECLFFFGPAVACSTATAGTGVRDVA